MNSEVRKKFNKSVTIDDLISWLKGYCEIYHHVNSIEILRIMKDELNSDTIEFTFKIDFE